MSYSQSRSLDPLNYVAKSHDAGKVAGRNQNCLNLHSNNFIRQMH